MQARGRAHVKKLSASSKVAMPTRALSPPWMLSSTLPSAAHAEAVAPLSIAYAEESIRKKCVTGIGGRTYTAHM